MMNEKRCVVTGLGLICAVGETVPECWEAVTHGVSGIRDVKSVNTEGCYATKGAEVSADNKALSEEDYDRSSLLCIKAASEALEDSGYTLNDEDRTRVGVVL